MNKKRGLHSFSGPAPELEDAFTEEEEEEGGGGAQTVLLLAEVCYNYLDGSSGGGISENLTTSCVLVFL